jgi:hypothetical protein
MDFTIAAVVWSPGIDVIVSVYDMGRQFDQRIGCAPGKGRARSLPSKEWIDQDDPALDLQLQRGVAQ